MALQKKDTAKNKDPAKKKGAAKKKQTTKHKIDTKAGGKKKKAKTGNGALGKKSAKKELFKDKEGAPAKKKAKSEAIGKDKSLKQPAKAKIKEEKKSTSSTKKGKMGIPSGGFKSGAVATIPFQMKKTGNQVNFIFTKADIVLLQAVKSSNPEKAAYMHSFYLALDNSSIMQRELNTLGVYPIRAGPIQNTTRSFTVADRDVPEQQLAVITGKGATKGAAQKMLKMVVSQMNKHTNTASAKQKHPTPTHLGDDLTPRSGPVALDALMTDSDVLNIIQLAYAGSTLSEIAKHKKIMGKFFTDVEHGKRVIESFLTGEPLMDNEDMVALNEEEEEEEEETEEEETEEEDDDEDVEDGDEDSSEEEEESDELESSEGESGSDKSNKGDGTESDDESTNKTDQDNQEENEETKEEEEEEFHDATGDQEHASNNKGSDNEEAANWLCCPTTTPFACMKKTSRKNQRKRK